MLALPNTEPSCLKTTLTVDTAHLLCNHNSRSAVVCTPDTWDGEAIPHTLEIPTAAGLLQLLLIDDVGVVVIPRGNDGMSTQSVHRSVAFCQLTVLHKPSWRFWAEKDADHEDEGRDECGSKLKTPGDVSSIFDDDICTEAEENTCYDPELPKHDQGATDPVRCHFRREDGDSSILGPYISEERLVVVLSTLKVFELFSKSLTDSNSHDKAGGEQALP